MSHNRLYKPEPCASWDVERLKAVGTAYREAASQGADGLACLEKAVAAYVAAGGRRSGATQLVLDMISSLSREQGDWLWGPAQALRDRQSSSDDQPDLFEPQEEEVASC